MTFHLKIECDNAAFAEPTYEIARILRELADKIEESDGMNRKIYDVNGNHVGGSRAQ